MMTRNEKDNSNCDRKTCRIDVAQDAEAKGSETALANGEQTADLLHQQLSMLRSELDTCQHRHR